MEHRCAACVLMDVPDQVDIIPMIKDLPFVCERNDKCVVWRWYLVGGPGCGWSEDVFKIYMIVAPFHDISGDKDEVHAPPPFNIQLAIGTLASCTPGCLNDEHEQMRKKGRQWTLTGCFDAMIEGLNTQGMREEYFADMTSAIHAAEKSRTGPTKLFIRGDDGVCRTPMDGKTLQETFQEEDRVVLCNHLRKNLETAQ